MAAPMATVPRFFAADGVNRYRVPESWDPILYGMELHNKTGRMVTVSRETGPKDKPTVTRIASVGTTGEVTRHVDHLHPLVARILATRQLVDSIKAEISANPHGRGVAARRLSLREQSLFLEGLELAAELVAGTSQQVTANDMQVLIDDLRKA